MPPHGHAIYDPPVTADVVRRFYATFSAGDFGAAAACFADDAVWTIPGRSSIAGPHRGRDAIRREVLDELGRISGGTFRVELLDVTVGREYVVAIQHATGRRDEQVLDITACQLITLDGKIATMRGYYSDQDALDAFWS
jgi:ketosteroid isomerase-like protein